MEFTWMRVAALLLVLSAHLSSGGIVRETEEDAQKFLDEFNERASSVYFNYVNADWNYNTDINEATQEAKNIAAKEQAAFMKDAYTNASKFKDIDFVNKEYGRLIHMLGVIGDAALDPEDFATLVNLTSGMETIYSSTKICAKDDPNKCDLNLEPELEDIMATSQDYDELLYVWKEWRQAVGPKIRPLYQEFIPLTNKASKLQGFKDTGALWRQKYESADFEKDMAEKMDMLKPMYEQLHAYVRRKLAQKYGDDKVDVKGGHIPAHLLGNMWAQQWGNIVNFTQPYPDKPNIDVTQALVEQNYTAEKMFRVSDDFFGDLGLIRMPQEFWNKSMLTKPEGRDVVCHASAWDFYNGKDFRIKQCTEPTMSQLITVHHEMGHIEYFLQYKDQPILFRDGANPGFHEAIGDVMALSVATPKHLHGLGLLPNENNDPEADINFLYNMALDKIAFLPFGYLIDVYRWKVFRGEISESDLNSGWWDLRCGTQGLSPPVARGEDQFDPGAKFHVPANVPYIRYFFSFILQFQLHRKLCQVAGHDGPLHACDINKNKAAGVVMETLLKAGSSRSWPEVLQEAVGTDKLDASAILDYFKPLLDFLKAENEKNGEQLGWPDHCPGAIEPTTEKPNRGSTDRKSSWIVTAIAVFVVVTLSKRQC